MLTPGDTIGILGGGQLGRMLAKAAARLGLKTHVFCEKPTEPATHVATDVTCARWDDRAALERFAGAVGVVTYEFENVPAETVNLLTPHVPVRPSGRALEVSQDRLAEKSFMNGIGIGTARFAPVDGPADLPGALETVGLPAILKTRRLGYDGKGQARLHGTEDADKAWAAIGAVPAILEAFVPFVRELSVIVARGLDGSVAAYDVVENHHRNHILARTLVPAWLETEACARAHAMARRIVTELDYVGVMGVELFETGDGGLLVNEVAPRVHNSGHWTQDACLISQFEQHVRAIAGWPLGAPNRHSDAVMDNLLGEDAGGWHALLSRPDTAVHLYGKGQMREGRKMGHVTRLFPKGQRPDIRDADH